MPPKKRELEEGGGAPSSLAPPVLKKRCWSFVWRTTDN
jgi:hypothetical protein